LTEAVTPKVALKNLGGGRAQGGPEDDRVSCPGSSAFALSVSPAEFETQRGELLDTLFPGG
jgi:hypothetical protein